MGGNKVVCPKCGHDSGNGWSQCGGVCPMPMSPHYVGELTGDARILAGIPAPRFWKFGWMRARAYQNAKEALPLLEFLDEVPREDAERSYHRALARVIVRAMVDAARAVVEDVTGVAVRKGSLVSGGDRRRNGMPRKVG